MSMGKYYRSDTGTIHLAPCAHIDETTPEWFAGQGVTMQEVAGYVGAAPSLRLCSDCWFTEARRRESENR